VSARRVVVIGDVMLDVIVAPTAPLEPTSDTPAVVRLVRGGSGANLASALARRHDVTFVGAAGEDVAAEVFSGALASAGVAASLERVDETTGTVVALIAPDGQRAMLTDRGANSQLSLEFVRDVLSSPFEHLHVSGYVILDAQTRSVARAALSLAREKGCSTSVDVCSVAPLRAITPDVFLDATAEAEMFFANEEEALAITGTNDVDDALHLLKERFDEVVVTRGARGVRAWADGSLWSEDALRVPVVDTTGAGDAATGAYLSARLEGVGPAASLRAAMASSALVVQGLGSIPSPTEATKRT